MTYRYDMTHTELRITTCCFPQFLVDMAHCIFVDFDVPSIALLQQLCAILEVHVFVNEPFSSCS